MKFNISTKTYKDKFIILPLDEFSWQRQNKILTLKFGLWKWAISFNFNF